MNGVVKMLTIFKRRYFCRCELDREIAKMLSYQRMAGNEERDINQRREDWKYGITYNTLQANEIEKEMMQNLLMQESVRNRLRKAKKSKRGPLQEHLERLKHEYELLMEEYVGRKDEALRLQAKLESSYK